TYELYPDLVRQVLATAQISYQNPTAPTYENCSFSFMADEKFCSISLHDHNELYEIADTPKEVSTEKKFAPANAFWDLIAAGQFTSRKAYQSQIRNPTLRITAKIVSTTKRSPPLRPPIESCKSYSQELRMKCAETEPYLFKP